MARSFWRRFALGAGAVFALTVSSGALACGGSTGLEPNTRFFVRHPDQAAVRQVADLRRSGDRTDANLLGEMLETPQAVWITGGSPKEAGQQVRQVVHEALGKRTVPVFVAYNIPGRDCANYSAGGAKTTAEYEAWIDAIAANLGYAKAVVILEPDGLGLLPSNCPVSDTYPFTDAGRYTELNYAVDALSKHNALVYLDATHDAWLNVGDISTRLIAAGVTKARGFFLNVSNFQYTENSVFYGTWISDCVTFMTKLGGAAGDCPNQYWNGGPSTGWQGTAMSPFGIWTLDNPVLALNATGPTERYTSMLGTTAPTTHFVVDTSRNGQGPWNAASSGYSNPEDWCNPPDRGLGVRPTAKTGNALADAYLWIKTPGESDGSCVRGTAGPTDPLRGYVDPAAGKWFPQQALELVKFANPALPEDRH